MMRLYACFNGHKPDLLTAPNTGRHMVCCPVCMVATHQHNRSSDAVNEWNHGGNSIWRSYKNGFFVWLYRWWKGTFI